MKTPLFLATLLGLTLLAATAQAATNARANCEIEVGKTLTGPAREEAIRVCMGGIPKDAPPVKK
jgi:hypothetical protein